ncbi:MAG: hypothetical protein DAHOPDDO_00621 [Ignavibacteriaceae bacterium]|nr:hypothetical protein [Ignavibacteriaceae bacterium]
MKNNFILTLLFIVCLSAASFAQLDSVYYLGPAAGNVPSGVTVTLNPMTFDEPISGDPIEVKDLEGPSINGNLENYDLSNLPPYIYTEDKPTENLNKGTTAQTVILDKWDGIAMTNSIPPDPIIAVGVEHVIACVNSTFKVWDKQGNLLASVNADSWISPVIGSGAFDPQIIYDHYANRWFMLWDWQDSPSQQGWFIISYSDNADPFGTWYMYKMDAKLNGTANSGTWGDFPQIGYDDQAIYINSRSFSWAGYYQYNKIRILDKSVLYASNGGVLPFVDLWSIGRPNVPSDKPDVLEPAICYTPGQGGYFFNTLQNGGVYTIMYKLLNPTSPTPRLRGKTLVVNSYGNAPLAQQLGGGTGIESGGSKHRHSPIVRDNYLYAAHSIANTTNASYSSVRYYKVDLSNASISEQAELGMIGYYYLYPALAIDKDHNILVTFSRSATTEYVGAFVSSKYSADPPGLNPSLMLQPGLGNYVVDFGSGRNRWGDYMGIQLDPVNEYEVWTFTEYVRSTNTWGTYVGRILMATYPGAHAYLDPDIIDFGEVEIGTSSQHLSTILTNYGDADLVISNIPATFDHFNLETNLSFPDTVASYDSLTIEFSYSPTAEGEVNVVYPVTSNDPQLSGVPLSGVGYDVVLATEKVFYASSGSQNSGDMITIDPVTGAGTTIGSSLFNEVTSISINPANGKIYGLSAGTSSSQLLKINAAEGDAHFYFTLNIPQLAAIAFDTSGVLYTISRAGELYTVNLENGATTFVVDAVGTYLGITFHPQTNELWATTRAIPPPAKETIFKVDITTGDTTIIGRTGLGKQTNDIIFDENLNLFGVIGTSSELNDFISINTSTGTGSIIGSVGFQHILSLAYVDQILTSVEDDNDGIIPSEYALMQNYPNPFNPTTKIDFSLPIESDVKLVIYNILGQEVIQLVNNQMTAGNHSVNWNANDAADNNLTSGIYFYQLNAGDFRETKKMILLK